MSVRKRGGIHIINTYILNYYNYKKTTFCYLSKVTKDKVTSNKFAI